MSKYFRGVEFNVSCKFGTRLQKRKMLHFFQINQLIFKGKLSDSFTNYNYVGNTKVSVSIKKT